MLIDHVFIFVHSKQDADELVNFGLTEGSGNIHQGAGTANRRFFFENFYLEIIWVENKSEAKNNKEIGIWERSNYQISGFSRFGLCLKNTRDTDLIFEDSIKWEAVFLSEGEHVDILTSDKLPWIFRFPINRVKNLSNEPIDHRVKIKRLTNAIFSLQKKELVDVSGSMESNSIVEFEESPKNTLVLKFDEGETGNTRKFEKLSLEIQF